MECEGTGQTGNQSVETVQLNTVRDNGIIIGSREIEAGIFFRNILKTIKLYQVLIINIILGLKNDCAQLPLAH